MGIESFLYSDEVEASAVFDLAVNAQIVNVNENDENPAVVAGLLAAWWALVEDDDSEDGATYDTPAERYADYACFYARACFRRKPVDSDDIWEPEWPKGVALPKRFVRLVGRIQGQKERAFSRACAAYHQEVEADKLELSPSEFEAKHGFSFTPAT